MSKEYNLIVIGGGPAGMMAAGRAAENGAQVLLLEKNDCLGVKLQLTGKGRCNLTNAEFDQRRFVAYFGASGKFLFSAFSKFGPQETINFFENRGVGVKVERGKRVFPASDQAGEVLNVLLAYLREQGVVIVTRAEVKALKRLGGKIEQAVLTDGREFKANYYGLTTGGQSYPATGSSGAAYYWLKALGHTIIPPRPALVPLIIKEPWLKELEGLSLKNVAVSLYQGKKKIDSRFGEALFTSSGLSGPIILDLSKKVGELLGYGPVGLTIDFKPALDFPVLDQRIQRDFLKFKNKMFKNSLRALLPQKLIPVVIRLSGINPEKKVSLISKEERRRLVHNLKDFKLQVKSLAGFDQAIVTAGGVVLSEVDPKTMRSKIIDNLFLAGEILDLDGPTGGFNLQVCWSTGYALAENFKMVRCGLG